MKYSKEYILNRVIVDVGAGCWEWSLSKNPMTGYGQVGSHPYTAHKASFIAWHERPPVGQVRHLCHNRSCCNPAHLSEGSASDNYFDSEEKHKAASMRRRGNPAANRIPVSINGVEYPSKIAAIKFLRVSPYTLEKLIQTP